MAVVWIVIYNCKNDFNQNYALEKNLIPLRSIQNDSLSQHLRR